MGAILVPGDKPAITRFLGIKMGWPHHQTRSQYPFHQIQDRLKAYHAVNPREHEVEFITPLTVDWPPVFAS